VQVRVMKSEITKNPIGLFEFGANKVERPGRLPATPRLVNSTISMHSQQSQIFSEPSSHITRYLDFDSAECKNMCT
jgi:hypothetical protein